MKIVVSVCAVVITLAICIGIWQLVDTAQNIEQTADESGCVVRAWANNSSVSNVSLPNITVDVGALGQDIKAQTNRDAERNARASDRARKAAIARCG